MLRGRTRQVAVLVVTAMLAVGVVAQAEAQAKARGSEVDTKVDTKITTPKGFRVTGINPPTAP